MEQKGIVLSERREFEGVIASGFHFYYILKNYGDRDQMRKCQGLLAAKAVTTQESRHEGAPRVMDSAVYQLWC